VATPEPDRHLLEIREQPAALRRAAEALLEQGPGLRRVAAAARERDRLILTGMGSSFDACYPAVEVLSDRAILALHAASAEVLHFGLPWITERTILVVVSQSGASAEVVRLAERARSSGALLLVAVTNGIDNSLASLADVALDTRAGPEVAPSSKTFAASLVLVGALARVLAGEDVETACSELGVAASAASDAIEAILADEDGIAERVAEVGRGRRTVAILGRGGGRATAEMGALTLQECGVVAHGFESAAFRHGPFELAGAGLGAIVVATEARTRALDVGMADDLVETGSAVLVLTDEPAPSRADAIVLPPVDPLLSPAVSMVPIQLLARRLAIEAGREPGAFAFATKVTARE
jgi:glucosamine--fructose-6-phosphate aminotransferase (isomerizing)